METKSNNFQVSQMLMLKNPCSKFFNLRQFDHGFMYAFLIFLKLSSDYITISYAIPEVLTSTDL